MRRTCLTLVISGLFSFGGLCRNGLVLADEATKRPAPVQNETVVVEGMAITATTSVGTITITAIDDRTRSYTWEGATRSVELSPQAERSNGSLGLHYAGAGSHWKEHNGITRGILEEGQQHFKTEQEALAWIRARNWMPYVYRDDGLLVGWGKTLGREQLNVEVWQIYVAGKKPERLPGSRNEKLVVTHTEPASEHTSLVQAVRKSNVTAVRALLAQGHDPNTKNGAGVPVLSLALRRGSLPVLSALLAKGADPNSKSLEGTTALLDAVTSERLSIVLLLLARKADVNGPSSDGLMTPLMLAAAAGRRDLVKVLLEAGAHVKAENAAGYTALHWAANQGHRSIAELLLQQGAAVDSPEWHGMTPLMMAVYGNHADVVKLLIAKGANVNARQDDTRLEYGRAAFLGDTATQKQIEQSGKLKARQENGTSVLQCAKIFENKEIIEMLKKAGAKE